MLICKVIGEYPRRVVALIRYTQPAWDGSESTQAEIQFWAY